VKSSKAQIHTRVHKIPQLRFEDQHLTSFAGLVVLQSLFSRLNLKENLKACFSHMKVRPIFGHHTCSAFVDSTPDAWLQTFERYGLLP